MNHSRLNPVSFGRPYQQVRIETESLTRAGMWPKLIRLVTWFNFWENAFSKCRAALKSRILSWRVTLLQLKHGQ
jgi:hypothetical protein